MGKRKIRFSYICVSAVVLCSMLLAVCGIMGMKNPVTTAGNSSLGTNNVQVSADDGNNYLGGVIEGYIATKFYETNPNYEAISSGVELKAFLRQEGKYANKNGYLTASFDFDWDDVWSGQSNNYTNMAPNNIVLDRVLDGCGETINLKGSVNTRDNGDTWVDFQGSSKGYVVNDGVIGIRSGVTTDFHCFGGLTNVLNSQGVIKNLTFNIYNTRYFTYYNNGGELSDNGTQMASVFGGLVGYNRGGEISNVVVSLNGKLGVTHNAGTKNPLVPYHESRGKDDERFANTVYGGLIVGVSRGGKLHNVTGKMNSGSNITGVSTSAWKGTAANSWKYSGVSILGGIAAYTINGCQINNAYMIMNGGTIASNVDKAGGLGFNGSHFHTTRKIGLIVCVNDGAMIQETMVEGNLNVLTIGGDSNNGNIDEVKSIFVATGDINGSRIYRNATGGLNHNGGMGNSDQGYKEQDNNLKVPVIIEANLNAYFNRDTDINSPSKFIAFVPENKILWQVFGEYKYEEILSGVQSNIDVPTVRAYTTELNTGINDDGEIGFYDGDVEVSDEVRNGAPLYYSGRKYGMKIKVQGKLYDEGIRVKNIGDLTNAMNTFDGHPVKMICNEEAAYINLNQRVVVLLDRLTGLDKHLTIKKRELAVTTNSYTRGSSNIFSGSTVKFGPMPDDAGMVYSGLVEGEKMMWQDDGYDNNVTIELNAAGRQMLRPSTNNYILKQKIKYGNEERWDDIGQSYFSAVINPYTLKVGEGVYINGIAVGSEYGIKNQKYDKSKLDFSYRAEDHHFTATALEFVWKHPVQNSGIEDRVETISKGTANNKGLIVVNKDISLADSFGRRITEVRLVSTPIAYTIIANEENGNNLYTGEHHYGELVTVVAEEKTGKSFVGWRRLNGEFISFDMEYSFKTFDNFTLTAVYDDIPTTGKIINKYYSQHNELLRTHITDTEGVDSAYVLKNKLGWNFDSWELTNKETTEEGEIHNYKAVFTQVDENAPKVSVVINDSEPTDYFYNEKITLDANSRYLVNNALVTTGKNGMELSAITDLTIVKLDEDDEGSYTNQSMIYNVFVYEDVYYINLTFVYGNAGDELDISLLNFNNDDITKLVKNGNIYQLTIEFSVADMECRFGPEAEVN
ncbi:MAG: hypothetical protein K2P12_05555, partial [Clostridia bacterium]|nr:hypothetical protein [Clostridia bacterium]